MSSRDVTDASFGRSSELNPLAPAFTPSSVVLSSLPSLSDANNSARSCRDVDRPDTAAVCSSVPGIAHRVQHFIVTNTPLYSFQAYT